MVNHTSEPRLRDVVKNDIKGIHLIQKLRQDIRDIKNFYLSAEKKERLQTMGFLRRAVWVTLWILKSMLLKLTPTRRFLFIIALVFTFSIEVEVNNSTKIVNNSTIATLVFVIILLLELKDKLLARDELETGRKVQRALMPSRKPHVPGWDIAMTTIPANEVGGDLIDFLAFGSTSYLLSIADVAGKGLHAALVTTKLQATLRALAQDSIPLSVLCTRINEIFWRDRLPSSFASLLTLRLTPSSQSVTYVNAGHLPPIIVRPSSCVQLAKGGIALGLSAKVDYCEETLVLQSGEALCIYSDGIPDTQNVHGEFYGTERLIALLTGVQQFSAEDITNSILADLRNFTGTAPVTDDISLIVLKKM